ncbi:apolipoprotein B-100-like [Lampris incognitus]|uniref:apolipoprotein B-100-like n=1 Tax=Lampris incognitus TaxID=2546036 RepID=UPI0024B4DB47|nr:apolipoprotein B-100-like [Lampris incognitus]
MGDEKLCFLLLLSTLALTYAQQEAPSCLLNQRYKAFHKYEYHYEAESLNAINGASHLRNGPKAFCKVVIDMPQTCSFIVRTTGCSLSEVVSTDVEGNPVFRPAPGSDAFAAEMAKYPLKVMVEGVYDVKLYPEEGETTTILNFKKGIISALAVPLLEEDKNKNMPTIHGMCKTHYSVNVRQDIATDISLTRDLSRCDKFIPMRDHTSPLALISGMHYPLAQLIRSTQTCNYKFDNKRKHMTSGSCIENHILVPFSHKGEYGVTNVGKQALTLLKVSAFNERVFTRNEANVRGLHMEAPEDKNVIQDKDAGLALLRELANLPETEGERRAHLFHKLVSMLRGMKAETLRSAIPKALEVSRALTFQVLAQCGTPECSSAIMQILRTYDSSSLEVDATIFALGLVSNPSPLLINDMLEMAQYKSSKPIMYALSNVVKRLYKAEGKLIPEIHSVAEFMAAQLGDCSGDKDHTFMTLRVIGNMAAAMGDASPALRTAVMKCVNQPAASPTVQQAAIQAFRLTPVPEEGREVLMQVLLDSANPLQKRVAAYLILMKDPQASELAQLVAALPAEQDQQAKSFVISHITNILSSTEPETQELRQKILAALQDNEIGPVMDPTKFSRNYKIGSVESNMIFEGTNFLPKEFMLEMTLKAFGYDIDMMEIGMEGKGFEPTVEALFGENGFFPDTTLKTMYFISDNMPLGFSEVLKNILPSLKNDRQKRQASQSLMREIGRNINKLVRELKSQESPEAMVYLRLLGNELGYLKTNDMEEMAYSAAMMIESMLKMFPTDLMKGLMTKTDNKIFAHYIFMDNEFFLPTATGIPLRIALSGTFTPGIKGGLNFAHDMNEVNFMPSAGIEFVTRVGSHIPDYVNSGLEMHTNLFHESGLTAKLSIGSNHVKLTIPPPRHPTKLLSITNTLVAVTGAEVKTIPPVVKDNVDVKACSPFFAGMEYCTVMQYNDAFSHETTPYFPFTGDSKMAIELHPTGDVVDYTATIAYELLKEGEEGRQKVDMVKMILRAEGAEPTEATATVKYNRRKHVLTTDIQIPDYDVEAGLRLGVLTSNTKGKATHSISLDLINKNIPQLSLVGRANLKAMKQAMLEVQLLIPSIKADATATANLKLGEKKELELKSDIKFLETTSEQKITVKYDDDKIEAEVKSDMNSKILDILPNEDLINKYVNQVLNMRVGETDMRVRHIITKSVEATNNYMEKSAFHIPYIQNFKVPEKLTIARPEKLFMNVESKAVYHFNNERFTIAIPLPLGGKSTEDLNFPPALSTPHLSLPQFGLEIVSMKIPIPELFVPESLTVSVPLFGKAEVSAEIESNLYDLEVSMTAGKDVVETPSYSAMFDVKGTSPLDIFSFKFDGSGMLSNSESIKAQLKSSLAHKFLEASITVVEDGIITDKISVKSSSKMEAQSPFGLNIALEHTGMVDLNTEQISADSNLEGRVKAGPIYGNTVSTQSFTIFPFKPEAKIDSSLKIDSTIVQVQNTIVANFFNGELSVVSNTNAFEDVLTHVAELSFREQKLSMKSDANTFAIGMKIRHQAEATAGQGSVFVKVETNADHSENHIYSLLTTSLDANGLAVNSDAAVKLLQNEATHKATLTMNKDGLTTSGKNTLKSPLTLENTYSAGLDASKATLSINNNAALLDIKIDNANTLTITPSNFDFKSKAESTFTEHASYTHDIAIHLKPYTASANMNNNLKLLSTSFVNEAQLMAEPYRMDLIGSMKSIYGEEEVKHTYQINYADLTASAKCSTTGKLFGTHMSQNTGLEIIGLAVSITNDARFNSQPMRFDHTIRASIVPFDFYFDAIFNADGDLTLYGKHSGQLYGKFLLKAQPLAFATSHEYRGSVTQQLNNGFSLETTMDNNMDTLLTPQEQKATFFIKTKLNNHALNQEVNAYNNAERFGVEMSSTFHTSLFNTASSENQEYGIAGFLKYDKSTESHMINLPFIENFPAFLEDIKTVVVSVMEALHHYINNEDIKAKLEAFPQHMSDFFVELNIEEKALQFKQDLIAFTEEYAFTAEDLETSLLNLKAGVEKLLTEIVSHVEAVFSTVKELIVSSTLSENVVKKVNQQLDILLKDYDIKASIAAVIDRMENTIKQIDMQKLTATSLAFLRDFDNDFGITSKLEMILSKLKQFIENFDIIKLSDDLKSFILSLNLEAHIEEFMAKIPTNYFGKTVETLREFIQNFGIPEKINTFHANLREMILKFKIDKKVEVILEKVVELIKQFNIDETVQFVANKLKAIHIPTKLMQTMEEAINYLKATEIKDLIAQLNFYLDTILQKLKSFNYNAFADEVNLLIHGYVKNVNEFIRALEIPQKLEATREFVNFILSSFMGFTEQLREIRIAEITKIVKDIMNRALFNDLRKFVETLKQGIIEIDVKAEVTSCLQLASKLYTNSMTIIEEISINMFEVIQKVTEQKIFSEVKQIFEGFITGLRSAELDIPSWTLPLTDLVLPSMKLRMGQLHKMEIPTQLDIPEFTILGFHTVTATTISFDDIRQRIIELIDFIVNFEIEILDMDAFFGDMTMNYLPALPEIFLPEINFVELSFPYLPNVPAEKLIETLQISEIKLPIIPSEITIPGFGKLYGEVRANSPIYTIRTAAQLQSSLDGENNRELTAFLTSHATSPSYEMLIFNLDSTARIAVPNMHHVIAAETIKFTHSALVMEHQASVTFYDLSAQARAKTTVKATSAIYSAEFVNEAVFATKGGLSGTIDTTYNHMLNLPMIYLNSEAALTQKAVVRQDGTTITLTIGNEGTAKFNSHDSTHRSDLHFTINPSMTKLTFTSDTDTVPLKTKQTLSIDSVIFSYIKFEARSEAEGPAIKNSLLVINGNANLHDMRFELTANHDTELVGAISGVLSNAINVVAQPIEVAFDFQNKGNTKVSLYNAFTAKIDLQNDYSGIFKPATQKINTIVLARLNQYKLFCNFTVDNNDMEAGILAAVDVETNLDFLTRPINLPEINLPFAGIQTPAINGLNLYEHTGLKHILTTTEQTFDVDAKIVYQKSKNSPLVDVMNLFQIPSLGNLITELSFKSAIINVNVNAGLYAEDDLVFRLGANTASVFEALKAKLDGTTSLTTKRGIKLANSLSLENRHIEGTHDSAVSVNTETFETAVSVATAAKITLPILNMEVNQNLIADTKSKANTVSTFKLRGDFNVPMIKAVGKVGADHSLKLEGTLEYISIESITKANTDSRVLENLLILGVLDNEVNLYLNSDGLRSTSKVISDVKLHHGFSKVISMDINENLAVEASMSRVYGLLRFTGNNEANIFTFNTKGKHVAQATVDIAPTSSLTADVQIDVSQPSNLGDLTIFKKTMVELTYPKQMISFDGKIVTPAYATNVKAEVEGDAPVFKGTFKSSATSVVPFLDYDLESAITTSFENTGLSLTGKALFNHADLTMEIQHVLSHYMSGSRHTFNVDITSPIFTDVNFRYSARKDGISTSVSIPSSGFLGLQFHGRLPSQMSGRLYGRYASAPENDVDFFTIRASARDADKMNLKVTFNSEAPEIMMYGLKERLPAITASLTTFGEKYQLFGYAAMLKSAIMNHIEEVYNTVSNHAPHLSQLSILFRNTVVQYQKTVQVFLDAAVKVLRESRFKLPGSSKMTTLPEVLNKLTSTIVVMVDYAIQLTGENLEYGLNAVSHTVSNVQVTMPTGDVMTGAQIIDQLRNTVKTTLSNILRFVKHLERLDIILEKVGETMQALVNKTQEFVDNTLKSDLLEVMAFYINAFYSNLISLIRDAMEHAKNAVGIEHSSDITDYVMDVVRSTVNYFTNTIYSFMKQAPAELRAYVKVEGRRIEINLPFYLYH